MQRPSSWLLLVLSLSSQQSTSRMRIWRALKALGAGVMRDGVYLLPDKMDHKQDLQAQLEAVRTAGGSAYLITFNSTDEEDTALRLLFDRRTEYEEFIDSARQFHGSLAQTAEADARRQWMQLRKQFQALLAIDFFPGTPQKEAQRVLAEAEAAFNRHFSPGEPTAMSTTIQRRELRDYQGRLWATRARPWVDRLASAWLIKRFIDPQASFMWLSNVKDCPADALGFDFDGAEFTHVGERVSFEVLLASFGLTEDPALARLGALVHFLDVGGVPVADAAGFAAILTGIRARLDKDDDVLAEASRLPDDLYLGYQAAR
jgi:hypothetical protein